ncbi:MAG: hypothetical protein EOP68_05740 [Sphingomonas sp.]|nr:MAG: hypothetical protein EOP68_05740 [Sphingomonas sp.]
MRRAAAGRERDQHESAGDQRGGDQGVGALMGVFGQRDARRQRRGAPQEDEVERILQREHRVECGERRRQRRDRQIERGTARNHSADQRERPRAERRPDDDEHGRPEE